MVEQRGVKVHFIGKPLCSKEHRRTAFPAKATYVSRTAFIADRHFSKEFPATILLPDPRRKGRGRRSAAALTMAVTDPIGTPNELKYASSAEASTSDSMLYLAAHDYSHARRVNNAAIHLIIHPGKDIDVDWAPSLCDPSEPASPIVTQRPSVGGH